MIPFASQRGFGQDLAKHLLNSYDNEQVIVADIRGAVARDLHGAFAEWEFQAQALTKCKKYLYSMSINPDPGQGPLTREQYSDYIERTEQRLGLTDQPRAIVFHEKYGREHCHVVWSRIDLEQEKAIQLSFDKDKLMNVTREFAHHHDLALPDGYQRDKANHEKKAQVSLYEMHQQRSTGLTKEQRMEEVSAAWKVSDNAESFVQALVERGYILATGKRPYVLVDLYGELNALPKLINDKSVRTKTIREFLGDEYPPETLPSVDEARKLSSDHRKHIEGHLKKERSQSVLDELTKAQAERRSGLIERQTQMRSRHHQERTDLAASHKAQRSALRDRHLSEVRELKSRRNKSRPRGLAGFLGRLSGVNLIRNKLHKFQDRQRVKAYLQQRKELKENQANKVAALALRQEIQQRELDRQQRDLKAVEKREQRSLELSSKAEDRASSRGGDSRIPAIPGMDKNEQSVRDEKTADKGNEQRAVGKLESEFEGAAAADLRNKEIELEKAFNSAAQQGEGESEGGSSEGLKPEGLKETASSAKRRRKREQEEDIVQSYRPRRDRSNDLDRGR